MIAAGAVYAGVALADAALHAGGERFAGQAIANAAALVMLLATDRTRRLAVFAGMAAAAFVVAPLLRGLAPASFLLSTLDVMQFGLAGLTVASSLDWWQAGSRGGDAVGYALAVATGALGVPAAVAVLAGAMDPQGMTDGWIHWWSEASVASIAAVSLYMTGRRGGYTDLLVPRTAALTAGVLALALVSAVAALRLFPDPFVMVQLPLVLAAVAMPPFPTAMIAVTVAGAITALSIPSLADLHAGESHGGIGVLMALDLVILAPVALALAVSEMRRGRTRFEASEERLRRLMDDAALGGALVDRCGRVRDANLSLVRMIGAPVVGRWFDELLHPDDREPARGIMAAVMTGRLDRDRSERRVLRADGTAFPATVAVIANTDFDRGMVGIIVQIEDISARKHAERKLAEAEERWKFALENSEQGVWDHDLAAGKTFLSPRWKALLGYAPHEIVDHPSAWVDLIHPEDRAAVIAADEAHRAGRTAMFDLEFRMRHRDGRWIWVRDRGKVVSRDAEGRALRMIGTHVDTTAERAAKAEQRRLDERIRLATDAAGIGLFEISEDAGIWWNERMHTLHGTDAGSLVPDLPRWIALVHPDDRRRLTRRAAQAFAGRGLLDAEYRIVRPDGTVRHIRAFAHRRTDEAPALVGTNWDVTAEREAVERLRRANSHIDQFATIASHDLQAPLRQIALWADLLHEDAAERLTDADREMIERIRRRARQTRRMVAGLLEFSRAGTGLALTTVDLSAMATEVVADFNRELAEIGGSAVVTPMPGAMADPLMVGQIFANLVSNAIKYRGERPLEIVFSGQSEPGFVVVTVRDNGIGIDPGDADAVFDLFTRLPAARGREGSGVGLAVCRRMADAMGGSIGVDTRVTGGSTFILKLRPVPPPNPGRSADAGRSTTA